MVGLKLKISHLSKHAKPTFKMISRFARYKNYDELSKVFGAKCVAADEILEEFQGETFLESIFSTLNQSTVDSAF